MAIIRHELICLVWRAVDIHQEIIMAIIHNLGFPRIGAKRELKFALEAYWKGESQVQALHSVAQSLRQQHWSFQSQLNFAPVGDFSFYDQVLDTSFLLGNVPERAKALQVNELDRYFALARGQSVNVSDCQCTQAGEMTKWFDTNYHFIVPEVTQDTEFSLHAENLVSQWLEAKQQGVQAKPVIIGPVTYLWLSKSKDGSDRLSLLPKLLPVYRELLKKLASKGIDWIQLDEPALVCELDERWQNAFSIAYQALVDTPVSKLIATYFGTLEENLPQVCSLPVQGLHVDAVRGFDELPAVLAAIPESFVLSVGVIDGRNIWKTNLTKTLTWLEPIANDLGERLWLAPSCSLLHVPVDLDSEEQLDTDIKSWLAFARQKLDELVILGKAVNEGRAVVRSELQANANAIEQRKISSRVHKPHVQEALKEITVQYGQRQSVYSQRAEEQSQRLRYPDFPTTTIGSFPQTKEIRRARRAFRHNEISTAEYEAAMKREIEHAVREQEQLGLDVLVHGEAERNDMVEFFGEQLEGYAFTQFGWVQSYGSRCVKPPVLFGDIYRSQPMTVSWTQYAQSLTDKPMKGMLTGPVTILNWSFVRDDQPRSESCLQLALAIRSEVLDLEATGVQIIQIDEAALREGLPLRKSHWQEYLAWAVESFRISANSVQDKTQIHTHMCYSEFNDIIDAIADMDADVITIETSRSDMELLDVFEEFDYPNEIGPGVYDIHSPNIPGVEQMVHLMQKAAERIPAKRLWVNPDCGLKTRQWDEVIPSLKNMVEASRQLRELY